MDEKNGTGVQYPTIELGGKTYEVKFNGSALYEMEKTGIVFAPEFKDGGKSALISFSALVDALKVTTGYPGTAKELAALAFDKRDEIYRILLEAWGNLMLPSLKMRAEAAANKDAAQPVQ